MITKEFMDLYKASHPLSRIQRAEVVNRMLEESFTRIKNLDPAKSEEEIWKEIFSSVDLIKPMFGLWRSREAISFTIFRVTKLILRDFVTFLNDKGIISNTKELQLFISNLKYEETVNIAGLENSYFRNIESLISYIDDVGKCLYYNSHKDGNPPAPDYDESTMLLDMKVIAILLWHGIIPADMIRLKNSDVHKSEEQCFITFRKNQIVIGEMEYQTIRNYIKAEKQSLLPRFPSARDYKKTNKLIKGCRDAVSANSICAYIKRFNKYIQEMTPFTKKITIQGLISGGFYSTVYEKEKTSQQSVFKIITQMTGENSSTAFNHSKEYLVWKSIFYPEQ